MDTLCIASAIFLFLILLSPHNAKLQPLAYPRKSRKCLTPFFSSGFVISFSGFGYPGPPNRDVHRRTHFPREESKLRSLSTWAMTPSLGVLL
ncbi:hypothetical protein DER45DRAFT_552343 [Fusarium avenaceum]|nr:hypothetical protein DER45DRAFT_552343 [Fusarium avenaceum]